MTATKTAIKKLCFTIEGPWLTDHCRSLWAEEERPDHAIKTLVTSLIGMTEEQAILVLTGKAKLTGNSSTGVKMVKDNAKKTKHGVKLPSAQELTAQLTRKIQRAEQDAYDRANPEIVPSPHGAVRIGHHAYKRIRNGESDWDHEVIEKVSPLLCHAKLKAPQVPMIDTDEPALTSEPLSEAAKVSAAVAARLGLMDVGMGALTGLGAGNMLDAFMAQMKKLDEDDAKPLKPDFKLNSLNGWIDREGRMYPCEYMGHNRLADKLENKTGGEGSLEQRGWLKISDSQDRISLDKRRSDVLGALASSRYTEAQKKTVAEWCGKHEREYPEWLKGE